MKTALIALVMLIGSSSFAESRCVDRATAERNAFYYLDQMGELEFPYAFADLTITEKLAFIRMKSNELQLFNFGDGPDQDWIVNIFAQEVGEDLYEEYLIINCKGESRKWIQRKQN